jgi:hypothetical protein
VRALAPLPLRATVAAGLATALAVLVVGWPQFARAADADVAARVLAGLGPGAEAVDGRPRPGGYAAYAREVDAAWARYDARTLAPLRAFVAANLTEPTPPLVFYPFGGPDLVNALTVFPRAQTYVLLGLEPVGALPAAHRDPPAVVLAGVKRLRTSLDKLLGLNFFRTLSMRREVRQDGYTGVSALMMFFLARTGHVVESVRGVRLSETGEIVAEDTHPLTGVEIVFRAADEPPETRRRALYFSGDLSDTAFIERRGLRALLARETPFATLLKAASYLMYGSAFDDVRNTILSRAGLIFQESSGLPYRHLRDKPEWQVRLFGTYDHPIELFSTRCQPDLKRDMARLKPAPFAFSFGYEHRPGEGHIIIARRNASHPPTEPVLDGSYRYGEATHCSRDRIVMTTCIAGRCSVRFD